MHKQFQNWSADLIWELEFISLVLFINPGCNFVLMWLLLSFIYQCLCIKACFFFLPLQLREHLAKGQRTLAGEGMSQIVRSLLELMSRKDYYSGDLLFSVEILRNVTDTFKRATYIPAPDDVQVCICLWVCVKVQVINGQMSKTVTGQYFFQCFPLFVQILRAFLQLTQVEKVHIHHAGIIRGFRSVMDMSIS